VQFAFWSALMLHTADFHGQVRRLPNFIVRVGINNAAKSLIATFTRSFVIAAE
jgi:hypothetical protein